LNWLRRIGRLGVRDWIVSRRLGTWTIDM
jgi:hypothetical protein